MNMCIISYQLSFCALSFSISHFLIVGPYGGPIGHSLQLFIHFHFNLLSLFNPRRACAARVTVVGSVCPLSHISSLVRLFVLKTLSRTQRATKVKKFVGFSLKLLCCRDPAPPPLYSHTYSRPFFRTALFRWTSFLNHAPIRSTSV